MRCVGAGTTVFAPASSDGSSGESAWRNGLNARSSAAKRRGSGSEKWAKQATTVHAWIEEREQELERVLGRIQELRAAQAPEERVEASRFRGRKPRTGNSYAARGEPRPGALGAWPAFPLTGKRRRGHRAPNGLSRMVWRRTPGLRLPRRRLRTGCPPGNSDYEGPWFGTGHVPGTRSSARAWTSDRRNERPRALVVCACVRCRPFACRPCSRAASSLRSSPRCSGALPPHRPPRRQML